MAIDYFDQEQIPGLIERLRNLTSKDKITWRVNRDNPFAFVSWIGDICFIVSSRDKDDLAPHVLSVYQRVTENPPQKVQKLQAMDSTNLPSDLASDLEQLYILVKRRTLQLDHVAENILEQLDRLDSGEAENVSPGIDVDEPNA